MTRDELHDCLPTLRRELLLYARGRAPADAAEDLVQEALVIVLGTYERLDSRGAGPWAMGVLKNLVRAARRQARVDWVSLDDERSWAPMEVAVGPRQETAARAGEALRLIGGLPKERRALFTEVAVLGGSLEEAAASRGLALGTVKSRLHRMGQELRSQLAGGRPHRWRRAA